MRYSKMFIKVELELLRYFKGDAVPVLLYQTMLSLCKYRKKYSTDFNMLKFSNETGISYKRVQRAMDKLISAKLVEETGQKGIYGKNIYRTKRTKSLVQNGLSTWVETDQELRSKRTTQPIDIPLDINKNFPLDKIYPYRYKDILGFKSKIELDYYKNNGYTSKAHYDIKNNEEILPF